MGRLITSASIACGELSLRWSPLVPFHTQLDSRVGVDEPLFQPFPPEIVFYHPNELEAVEATLWLRNNDNVSCLTTLPADLTPHHRLTPPLCPSRHAHPASRHLSHAQYPRLAFSRLLPARPAPSQVARRVKVLKPSSPHLEVFPVARKGRNGPIIDGNGKVAAGMEIAFTVRLTPPAGADFATDLVLATEREKFLVPVRAIGARACLDLPDVVAFEPTPAKESRTRPLLIRNVGTRAGSFELRASGPYSVSPTVASLDVRSRRPLTRRPAPPVAPLPSCDCACRCVAHLRSKRSPAARIHDGTASRPPPSG